MRLKSRIEPESDRALDAPSAIQSISQQETVLDIAQRHTPATNFLREM
jgi:cell division protein FtsL